MSDPASDDWVIQRLRAGGVIVRTEGERRVTFTVEGGGGNPRIMNGLLFGSLFYDGIIVGNDDGLFSGTSQTYRLKE